MLVPSAQRNKQTAKVSPYQTASPLSVALSQRPLSQSAPPHPRPRPSPRSDHPQPTRPRLPATCRRLADGIISLRAGSEPMETGSLIQTRRRARRRSLFPSPSRRWPRSLRPRSCASPRWATRRPAKKPLCHTDAHGLSGHLRIDTCVCGRWRGRFGIRPFLCGGPGGCSHRFACC